MCMELLDIKCIYVIGIELNLEKSKLPLDCIMIITSVVPPGLPMELSPAVNALLDALRVSLDHMGGGRSLDTAPSS